MARRELTAEERDQALQARLWSQAKRQKHYGLTPDQMAPNEQRVSVHDYDDTPSDEVRAAAAEEAAAARALVRSQMRGGK